MKRVFDFSSALCGLIVLSPLFLLVAGAMKLVDRGPVFYLQTRVGKGGRPFRMWKFRSMRQSRGGPAITVGNDSRITPIGHILRQTKIDELPQLWNVLCGDMSLVGPRPEVERYTALYKPEQKRVLDIKPGITDPASFALYNESEILSKQANPEEYYVNVLMVEKIRINLDYAAKSGLISDLLVIVLTVLKPFGLRLDLLRLLEIREPAL